MEIIDLANELIANKKYIESTHVIETILIHNPSNNYIRLNLAQIYIKLKENSYRMRAKFHLEYIINSSIEFEDIKEVVSILMFNVYLTHGGNDEATVLLNKFSQFFTGEQISFINTNLKVSTNLLNNKNSSVLPNKASLFDNFDYAFNNYIINQFSKTTKRKLINKKFFTYGSCFAGNVAREMKARGICINSFFVGEEVNTTFSNVNLLKYIFDQNLSNIDYYQKLLLSHDINLIKSNLITSEILIFTLGVAPAFFDNNKNYYPHSPDNLKSILRNNNVKYRFSTVDENIEELMKLKKLLIEFTNIRYVFLTVSPVPLNASLLTSSTIVDDSESKSILRSSAGIVSRTDPDFFIYFPSFEAFRWLPCFNNYSGFGEDDDNTRHANESMVKIVVNGFLKMID
jgi:hypothetical protein